MRIAGPLPTVPAACVASACAKKGDVSKIATNNAAVELPRRLGTRLMCGLGELIVTERAPAKSATDRQSKSGTTKNLRILGAIRAELSSACRIPCSRAAHLHAESLSRQSRTQADAARVLLVGVSLGCRQILAQFLCRAAWPIPRRIALNAPSFLQRPGIHDVETELVEQCRHGGLRRRIVARDRKRAPVPRSRRLPVG